MNNNIEIDDQIQNNIITIRQALHGNDLYLQLAEESTELAQAAMKLVRVLRGRNPTPVTLKEAMNNLGEEANDVIACLMVSDVLMNYEKIAEKLDRWVCRLNGRNND